MNLIAAIDGKGDRVTKEGLKQIFYLNQEIKMWQRELEKLQYKSLIKGQEITGMPFVTGTSDKVGDLVTQICDTEAVIRGLLARIQIERRKAIEYIESLDDSLLRQIMFLRNVSCMNWNQVACETGNNENCVKQIYSRHFRKVEDNG